MCPFCGNFYDSEIEYNLSLRSDSRADNSSQNLLRLPSIVSTWDVLGMNLNHNQTMIQALYIAKLCIDSIDNDVRYHRESIKF